MKSIIFAVCYLSILLSAIVFGAVTASTGLSGLPEYQEASDIILIVLISVSVAILVLTIVFRQSDGRRYLESMNGKNVDKNIDYFKKAIKYQIITSIYFPVTAYYVSLCMRYGRNDEALNFMKKHPKYYKYRALTYFYCLMDIYNSDIPGAKEKLFELKKGGMKYDKQIELTERLISANENGNYGDLYFIHSVYPIVNQIIDRIIKERSPESTIAIEVNEHIEEV